MLGPGATGCSGTVTAASTATRGSARNRSGSTCNGSSPTPTSHGRHFRRTGSRLAATSCRDSSAPRSRLSRHRTFAGSCRISPSAKWERGRSSSAISCSGGAPSGRRRWTPRVESMFLRSSPQDAEKEAPASPRTERDPGAGRHHRAAISGARADDGLRACDSARSPRFAAGGSGSCSGSSTSWRGCQRLAASSSSGLSRRRGRGVPVAVPEFLVDELVLHMTAYMRPRAEDSRGEDLVFTTSRGNRPLRRTNFVRREWGGAVRAARLDPGPTPHDLRHTAAALAIRAGAHPKAIQSRMGHASITTTLNTYGHLFEGMDEELAANLDTAYRAAQGGNLTTSSRD
jgi:integrase-like protein